jgi:hypothetical protein
VTGCTRFLVAGVWTLRSMEHMWQKAALLRLGLCSCLHIPRTICWTLQFGYRCTFTCMPYICATCTPGGRSTFHKRVDVALFAWPLSVSKGKQSWTAFPLR